jgi:hypothetical protein
VKLLVRVGANGLSSVLGSKGSGCYDGGLWQNCQVRISRRDQVSFERRMSAWSSRQLKGSGRIRGSVRRASSDGKLL